MTLLSTRSLRARYGDFQAIFGIDIDIWPGQVVGIVGVNGAGKSTLLKSVAGLVRVAQEAVLLDDVPSGGLPAFEMVRRGVALVPEGRRLFPSLTVEENLMIGGQWARPGPWNLNSLKEAFPLLHERRHSLPASLSGGQQQMVAVARALMSNPRLLLCDELSLGLSPSVVEEIYSHFPAILANGTAVVLVEQDIGRVMREADYVYCLQKGRVSLEGRPDQLTREAISVAYFGKHASHERIAQ